MKVALLLFGQPRFADKPEIFASYKNQILDLYDTDTYCHMWYEPNAYYHSSTWSGIREVKVPENAPDVINDLYHPVKMVHQPPMAFSLDDAGMQFIFGRFPNLVPVNLNNIFSQLFSVQSVARLVETPDQYDWIVLGRYDTILLNFPKLETLDPEKFYLQNNNPPFPDMIHAFAPKFLQWAGNTFDDIPNSCNYIHEPTPEQFKFFSYVKYFNPQTTLQPHIMYGEAVRSY